MRADEFRIVGVRERQQHQPAHSFAGMEPVGLGDEVFVVGAVLGDLGERGAQFLVLLQVALIGALVVPEHRIGGAHGVQERPIVEDLDGVVGTVERAPSRRVEQIAAFVEVALGKPVHRERVGAQQFPLEQRPFRRRHRLVDNDADLCRSGQAAVRRRVVHFMTCTSLSECRSRGRGRHDGRARLGDAALPPSSASDAPGESGRNFSNPRRMDGKLADGCVRRSIRPLLPSKHLTCGDSILASPRASRSGLPPDGCAGHRGMDFCHQDQTSSLS